MKPTEGIFFGSVGVNSPENTSTRESIKIQLKQTAILKNLKKMGSTIIFGKVMKPQDKIPSSSKKTPVPPRRIPNKTLCDREHLTPHEVESVMEVILQAFNGHFEDKRQIVVYNFLQTLKVSYNSKLNGVFDDYKKPLHIQKYFS